VRTTSEPDEVKNQMRITNSIYYSLIIGMLLFFSIVIVLIQGKNLPSGEGIDKIFIIVVPVFGLMMMVISRVIYNLMISKYEAGSSLIQKLSYYRTAKIIAWAVIESACFFAIIATMLTSNYLYVAVFVFLLGYFFLIRPSKESLIRDMQLNSDESDLILKS